MNILVTGAAGFIGSHVTDQLLASGHHVIGLDTYNDFYDPGIKRKNIAHARTFDTFKMVEGSILDKKLLQSIASEQAISAIIHLAAYAGVRPSIEYPELYYSTNVDGTNHILDMAKDSGCKRVLVAFLILCMNNKYRFQKQILLTIQLLMRQPRK